MFVEQQSSRNIQECSICCEIKHRTNQYPDNLRPAQICYDCWYKHISNVVLRMGYQVGDNVLSPFSNAPSIDIITCLNSLKQQHCNEIEETLFRKYNSFTKDIEKCPAETCDYVYVGAGQCNWRSKNNTYNCPKCQAYLAVNQGYSFKRLLAAFYLLLSNKCPKCQIPIQKISGCPHMTCPCGHHFCWYCYKDHPSGGISRFYTQHNIPQCGFIFLSKIVLFCVGIISMIIVSSGSSIIDQISEILSLVFSILIRIFLMDGTIIVQIMIVMMLKKRRRFIRFNKRDSNTKFILAIILVNILILLFLEFLGELSFCIMILAGEILFSVFCFAVGYGIVFSIETWFQFVG